MPRSLRYRQRGHRGAPAVRAVRPVPRGLRTCAQRKRALPARIRRGTVPRRALPRRCARTRCRSRRRGPRFLVLGRSRSYPSSHYGSRDCSRRISRSSLLHTAPASAERLQDCEFGDRGFNVRSISTGATRVNHSGHEGIQSACDFTEHGVTTRGVSRDRGIFVDDEKLAAVAVTITALPRHGKCARRVQVVGGGILDRPVVVAGATATVSLWVAALQDPDTRGGEAVARQIVIEAALGESKGARPGLRGLCAIQFDGERDTVQGECSGPGSVFCERLWGHLSAVCSGSRRRGCAGVGGGEGGGGGGGPGPAVEVQPLCGGGCRHHDPRYDNAAHVVTPPPFPFGFMDGLSRLVHAQAVALLARPAVIGCHGCSFSGYC